MNAHNEQQWPEYLMLRDTGLADDAGGLGQRIFTTAGAGYVKQKYVRADIAAQPAAAQEAAGWQVFNSVVGAWQDASKSQYESRKAHYPEEARELYAAPVTAAPGIDLTPLWRLSDEWLKEPEGERQSPGENRLRWAMAKELRDALTLLDASPKDALPTLPDDFSESKDWRAGSYGERVEWLMDTVRSQREHIDSLLDSPKGGSEAVTDWEDGLLDGDSATLQAQHNARYEVWFAITEAHHGVWRAAFNPDTEVDHSQEVPIGTFATKREAQSACEEHAKLARAADGMQAQASDAEVRP